MEEKTIGQVLQTAREEQNLSISDTQRLSKIKKRYLRALENDEFEEIPGGAQARTLLRRYAEFLELDVDVILDAYDSDTSLTVYEVETKDARTGRMSRRSKKKRRSTFLPIFYLSLLSISIVAFVFYTVWAYGQKETAGGRANKDDYRVLSGTSGKKSSGSAVNTKDSSMPDSSAQLSLELTGADGEYTVMVHNAPEQVEVRLSVTDASSWLSLSHTDLAEGVTLSPENPSVTTMIDKQLVPEALLTLGTVQGLTVEIGGQQLDLSSISGPSANIRLTFNQPQTDGQNQQDTQIQTEESQ